MAPSQLPTFIHCLPAHDLDMPSLSLLHHYHAYTSTSLFSQVHMHSLFQRIIPSYAIEHPFLMHGLLAVASLHRAVDDPSQRVQQTNISCRHQTKALETYLPSLNHVTRSNCDAIWAFSALTAIQAFAYQRLALPGDAINAALQVVGLSRGMGAILAIARTWMTKNKLDKTLRIRDRKMVPLPSNVDRALHRLTAYSNAVYGQAGAKKAEAEVKALTDAINRLRETLGTRGIEDRMNHMTWPVLVPEKFVEMLKEGHEFALVLLAYYGASLHQSLRNYWWSKSFGERLVEDIRDRLGAAGDGSRWSELLEWPLEQIEKKPDS